MKVVKVRSPFIVEVGDYGFVHTGSRIILTVWNDGETEPTSGQSGYYSLSKNNPSITQKSTIYNVSNYVKEFIENIKPTKTVGDLSAGVEDSNEWCKFRVRKYWFNGATYTEIGSGVEYVGINGFQNYTDGNQSPLDINGMILTNSAIRKNILKTTNTSKNYFNFLIDVPSGGLMSYTYFSLDGSNSTGINLGTLIGIYNYKIPLTNYPENNFLENGCRIRVRVFNASFAVIYEKNIFVNALEECKYTPVECSFINRYGGWEFLTFFKAQSNSISAKGTDYKLTQSAINYNTAIGQFKTFNINGKQTVKLNTGWVDENYSELISDILLSETVLLNDVPVTVKSQSSDFKTTLKDKNINYELEFEYAFNLINDVV